MLQTGWSGLPAAELVSDLWSPGVSHQCLCMRTEQLTSFARHHRCYVLQSTIADIALTERVIRQPEASGVLQTMATLLHNWSPSDNRHTDAESHMRRRSIFGTEGGQREHLDDPVRVVILGHEHFVDNAGLAGGCLPRYGHGLVGRRPVLAGHVLGRHGALLVDEDVPGSHHLPHSCDPIPVQCLVPPRCTRLHSADALSTSDPAPMLLGKGETLAALVGFISQASALRVRRSAQLQGKIIGIVDSAFLAQAWCKLSALMHR